MKNSTSHASSGARRAESHRQAGLLAHRARRWDEAVREFERATELAPQDALMWMNLARSRMARGQATSALDAARRACELDRSSPVACRMAAELALQMARPAEALEVLQALAPDAPRDHDYYNALGNALFQVRRPREAVDAYFQALESAPWDLDPPLADSQPPRAAPEPSSRARAGSSSRRTRRRSAGCRRAP